MAFIAQPWKCRFLLLPAAVLASVVGPLGCGDNLRDPTPYTPVDAGFGEWEIAGAKAHWLRADVIAWPAGTAAETFELHYADSGIMRRGAQLTGSAGKLVLAEDEGGLSPELRDAHPHLAGYRALRIAAEDVDAVPELLQGQLLLVGRDEKGAIVAASRVQIPGVLDDLYAYDGPLGVEVTDTSLTFRLWAPTARWVKLHVYDKDSKEEIAVVDMTRGERGVWSAAQADRDAWYGHYYKYEVYVYSPAIQGYPDPSARMVTDPYALGLSQNSEFGLIIDLDDPATKPEGWDQVTKPELAAPEDIVIYEAHVRDFSVHDLSVPAAHRGTYMAFTHDGTGGTSLSDGMKHLQLLQEAGLTHLHVLPAFDIATINEDPGERVDLDDSFDDLCARHDQVPAEECTAYAGQTIRAVLESLDPATEDAQRIVGYMRDMDGFNWGYDPFHYTTPEGSYATSADGVARIVEFRAMVQALARSGLRVALDVVYNHTHASGLADKSVLDKIVPGYYHRRNVDTGEVERSTCCENTASEHAMMEKLMIDSLLVWAKHYKIDAFRFDLMGHHMKANMLAVKEALASLTVETDGVDGSEIYLYGEGWNFGEVANGARGTNATQLNMAGTGIGTFSDRLRDAVRGGGPFDSKEALVRNQGFISGMYYDPNDTNTGSEDERAALLLQADQIRVGLAGNLRDFVLVDRKDAPVAGSSVCYGTSPAGYTEDPQEVITYVAKHDNQTLWDISQYKIPAGTDMDTRVRIHNLGASIVLMGQGVPFVHMGMDMLRSKSMERDSYDSGDWFNRVDFTYQSNNWNVGLPRADKDGDNYPFIEDIIADASIDPQPQHIEAAVVHFREMLAIRKSSELLRLETKDEVMRRVDFHNTGSTQVPGLIVMSITDGACAGADLDRDVDAVVVVINASDEPQTAVVDGATGFELHPIQKNSADAVVQTASFTEETGAFAVPARTAAVFVQPQGETQGAGLACNERVASDQVCNDLLKPVYVRGSMNDWGAPAEARLVQDATDETVYTVELDLEAGTYEFKIADEGWASYNWGSDGDSITPGDGPYTLTAGGGNISLTIDTPGVYRFELGLQDINQPTLSVSPVS